MTAALLGAAAVVVVMVGGVVGVVFWLRTLQHRRTILTAAFGMSDQLRSAALPQRELLSEVAELLLAQEEAAVGLEAGIRELPAGRTGEIADLFADFNKVEEPMNPLVRFLGLHACRTDQASLTAFTGEAVWRATRQVMAEDSEDLRPLAVKGSAGPVARTVVDRALAARAGTTVDRPVPRLNGDDMETAVKALDVLTRRQLRLATLLHDQAETILKGRPDRLLKIEIVGGVPRARRLAIDLPGIRVALDAAGESLDIAGSLVAADEPARAVRLLAGLHLPAPEGFPGRVFHREILAQTRPLTEAGIRHRLSVARWAAETRHARRHLARRTAP